MLVATPALKRSPTTRSASAARRGRRPSAAVDGGAARVELEPALADLEGDLAIELGDARPSARAVAAALRLLGARGGRRPRASRSR